MTFASAFEIIAHISVFLSLMQINFKEFLDKISTATYKRLVKPRYWRRFFKVLSKVAQLQILRKITMVPNLLYKLL